MKAMILAAGRGERLRPLTDSVPKPLLEVGGKALIEHHLEKLAAAGVRDIVVNHGRLGHRLEERLGNGHRFGVRIQYSPEGDEPLETGGGIFRVLPMLGEAAFMVVNADVWSDYPYTDLRTRVPGAAHVVLVPNPAHHPEGDFGLQEDMLDPRAAVRFTYSGLGVYHAGIFRGCQPGRFPLAPLIRAAAIRQQVTAELYTGVWFDAGTLERLHQIDAHLGGI